MAPLRYAAKFDPFLSLDRAPHPGTIQGKEGIKFCYLATLPSLPREGFIIASSVQVILLMAPTAAKMNTLPPHPQSEGGGSQIPP